MLIAWLVAMPSRQLGHFFFEPQDYDHANQATHEYKEQVKVGYNLRRKVVLLSIWILSPALLLIDPALVGLLDTPRSWWGVADNVAAIWLVIGAGAVIFRTVHLFFLRDIQTGLVWCTKILTDPFHDVKLYFRCAALRAARRAVRSDRERSGGCGVGRRVAQPGQAGRGRFAQQLPPNRAVGRPGGCHHQPSSRIARPAATTRSATAATSAFV